MPGLFQAYLLCFIDELYGVNQVLPAMAVLLVATRPQVVCMCTCG